MADIVWDDVTNVAKDLAGVPAAFQTLAVNYANEAVNPDAFGGEGSTTLTLARSYFAAHYAALWLRGAFGKAGLVSSQSEGGISQSFAAMTPTSPLSRTNYGDTFLAMAKRAPASVGFVTC